MSILWVFGVCVIAVFMYFFFFSSYTRIRIITVRTDTPSVFEKNAIDAINEYADDAQWYIFSRRNYFFFSTGDVRNFLDERFSSFRDIEIVKHFPDSVTVSFSERETVALWCGREECFGIDERGYAFQRLGNREERERETGKPFPVIFANEKDAQRGFRENVIDPGALAVYVRWDDFLRSQIGEGESSFYFDKPEEYQEYSLQTERGWEIRAAKNIPLEETFRKLETFLNAIPEEKKQKLSVLDLRIAEKVFFTEKEKEEDQKIEEKTDQEETREVRKESKESFSKERKGNG